MRLSHLRGLRFPWGNRAQTVRQTLADVRGGFPTIKEGA